MRAYSVNALVLRTYRYAEADRIVVFLTEDRGKKRGVAKNASASRRRFGAALEPLTSGRVASEPLITHHYPLDQIGEAFIAAADKKTSQAVKVLVHPNVG